MTIERVNERELLTAAAQGSQVAYRELIHLHQSAVYRFAWAMIGDEDAQRITENAFITAWRQLDFLKDLNLSFRDRLLQLVCIDCDEAAKRQRRHRVNLPSAQDENALNFPVGPLRYDPRTNMEHLALQTDIEEALRTLPLHFRKVLLLHEMGELADTQIADMTGSDAQTVHEDLIRSRGFVRRQIILSGGFFPASDGKDSEAAPKYRACSTYLPTLAAAADDLCTGNEKQALSAHLANCPGCRGYYESLRAIHHGIAVMKREVPGDMASYIIHKIQQEAGMGDFAAPNEKPPRRHFRPAFGRFTVIGLCLALVLLAYSNGILERAGLTPSTPGQGQTSPPQTTTVQPQPTPGKTQTPSGETPTETPTENTPDPSVPETPEDPDSTIVPDNGGNNTSASTLVPEGETYNAVYTLRGNGGNIIDSYASLSFRVAMADGTRAVYYVVPVSNAEDLNADLDAAGLTPQPYTEEPQSIDTDAPNQLYIVYMTTD